MTSTARQQIVATCPNSKQEIPTGLWTTAEEFGAAGQWAIKRSCPACNGEVHTWERDEVFLADD